MYVIGILAAFISPASHSLSNIFDAYITGNLFKKISTTIFYANITNALGFLALLLIGPIHLLPANIVPYAVLIGLINVGYLFPYYSALRCADTSIVAAMFSLDKIFIPFWAYLIVDEVMNISQYVGLGMIVLFSLILNIDDPKKIKINKCFWLMLLVAVMLSFEGTLYKRILQESDWISTAFWCSILTFVLRWGVLFFSPMRQDIVQNFPTYKANFSKFCFIEIFDQLGNFGPVFALSIIPVVVEAGINSTQPVFVIIYGFILAKLWGNKFKEKLSHQEIIKKIMCFVFIGIGVILVIG